MTGGRIGRTTAVIFAALLVGPGSAQADDFYASPTGSGNTCSSSVPCDIYEAVNQATDAPGSNNALLYPGTYPLNGAGGDLKLSDAITLKPAVAGARPEIQATASQTVWVQHANARAEDLRVVATNLGSSTYPFRVESGVGDRLEVVADGAIGAFGVLVLNGALRNSTVRTVPDSGVAIVTSGTTATIENVTAISSGATSVGLRSRFSEGTTQTVNVVNSILDGTQTDILAEGDDVSDDIEVTVDYSNYQTVSENPALGGTVAEGGNNVSGEPFFLDRDNGDFHQLSTSPTVDQGTNFSGTDLDGQTRANGTTDIGADELFAPDTPTLTATSPGSGADDNNPEFLGSSDPAIVSLHPDPACEQPLVATGLWSAFAAPGLTVTVPDNSTTTLYAIATLGSEETTSDCSAGLSYQEATPIPPTPPPGVQSLTPSLNQRAVAIKRCKRKFPKGSKKRKKCLRRARRLPL